VWKANIRQLKVTQNQNYDSFYLFSITTTTTAAKDKKIIFLCVALIH
jgi:hypothetical protein